MSQSCTVQYTNAHVIQQWQWRRVIRDQAYLLLHVPDCALLRAAPPCLTLIENEWLPGGCRVLSKKPLKLQSAWFLESAGCKSVLSAGWVLLWGSSPINTAHSPLSRNTGKKLKKNTPQLSHIPLWQNKWQLQSATSKNHNFTVTIATKLGSAQQGLLS